MHTKPCVLVKYITVIYLFRLQEQLRSIVNRDECVCLCVCPTGYLWNHRHDLYQFLCILPMSVDRSSSGMSTIGCIAYRQEGGDGIAQRRRSVICDCLVLIISCFNIPKTMMIRKYLIQLYHTTTPQPYYGPFSRTTRVSQCQNRTSGLHGARGD